MITKLTLRIGDDLIESAKEYSAQTGKSVSRIVADLFEIIKKQWLITVATCPLEARQRQEKSSVTRQIPLGVMPCRLKNERQNTYSKRN